MVSSSQCSPLIRPVQCYLDNIYPEPFSPWDAIAIDNEWSNQCVDKATKKEDLLKSIPDVNLLVDISTQLRKPPSEENKFLQESDRQEIITMAATYLNTALKTIRDR